MARDWFRSEGHSGLARRAGEHLSPPPGAVQQDASGHLAAEAAKPLGPFHELDDLQMVFLGGLEPRDIVERHVDRRRLELQARAPHESPKGPPAPKIPRSRLDIQIHAP